MSLHCSTERPWGVHSTVRNDEDCPRCGWTAPGPRGDALADAAASGLGDPGNWAMPDQALAA